LGFSAKVDAFIDARAPGLRRPDIDADHRSPIAATGPRIENHRHSGDQRAWPELSQINASGPLLRHSFFQYGRTCELKMPAKVMDQQSQVAVQGFLVAIVDDDSAVCSSLKFSLELEGFRARTFANGAEFLAAGDFGAFNCLVIDQRMPGMSGMELIARLRDQKVRTPAILIISHPNAALSARAAAAGVPIVEKPLLGNVLVEKIREACEAG
jgi:CheY-like chemotaxis protein